MQKPQRNRVLRCGFLFAENGKIQKKTTVFLQNVHGIGCPQSVYFEL